MDLEHIFSKTFNMYSLTEIAKKKNPDNPSYVIQSWLRDINTLQFLYLWEKDNNQYFIEGAAKELIEKINSYDWNPEFLKNSKNTEEIISHYDLLIDEGNDPVHDADEMREYMDKWDGQAFVDAMKLSKDKDVLEIGVGTGRLAIRIAPCCSNFTGVDISPKTVETAKSNLSKFENVTIICDDFIGADFGNAQFDVIYSSLTFMHISDKLSAMKKVSELLKTGGIFVLSIDKKQDETIDFGTRIITLYPDTPENIQMYTEATGLMVESVFETEFANVLVIKRKI